MPARNSAGQNLDQKSTARLLSSANTDNATAVKTSAARLYKIRGLNTKASVVYLKLYNKASAPASTDTPVHTLALKASDVFDIPFPDGYYFSLGLGYRLVTGSADNDNTAVASGDVLGLNIDYI